MIAEFGASLIEKISSTSNLPGCIDDAKVFFNHVVEILGANPARDVTLFCDNNHYFYNKIVP